MDEIEGGLGRSLRSDGVRAGVKKEPREPDGLAGQTLPVRNRLTKTKAALSPRKEGALLTTVPVCVAAIFDVSPVWTASHIGSYITRTD